MSLLCIFNRFSVYLDVVSNDDFDRFRIQTLSLCKAITFLFTELHMFLPEQRPLGSVSIIEPEAPGVLLRYCKRNIVYNDVTLSSMYNLRHSDAPSPTNNHNKIFHLILISDSHCRRSVGTVRTERVVLGRDLGYIFTGTVSSLAQPRNLTEVLRNKAKI